MQRYNQRMAEQLKARQQQEKARLPKIQRSEGKTRMAMYKKSLHISGAGSAAEQREKIKQVGPGVARSGSPYRLGGSGGSPLPAQKPHHLPGPQASFGETCSCLHPHTAELPSAASSAASPLLLIHQTPSCVHQCGSETGSRSCGSCVYTRCLGTRRRTVSWPHRPGGQGRGVSSEGDLQTGRGPSLSGAGCQSLRPPWHGPRGAPSPA